MSTWAIREDIITTNYASYVKIPELKKVEKSIFTDEDIKKLRKDNSESAMIVLMLGSFPIAYGSYVINLCWIVLCTVILWRLRQSSFDKSFIL